LGFSADNPIFESARNEEFNLIKCEYEPDEQRELCRVLVAEFGKALEPYTSPDDADLLRRVREFFTSYKWIYALVLLSASFKQKGFSEEAEWRFVSQYPNHLVPKLAYRPGRFGVVPYFPLPLAPNGKESRIDRIVIGPNGNKKAAGESLQRVLKTYQFKDTEIVPSNTPLRQ
jgi:hypothetical protein